MAICLTTSGSSLCRGWKGFGLITSSWVRIESVIIALLVNKVLEKPEQLLFRSFKFIQRVPFRVAIARMSKIGLKMLELLTQRGQVAAYLRANHFPAFWTLIMYHPTFSLVSKLEIP